MATLGALIGTAIGGFGKKPKIPQLPKLSPDAIQSEAISGNIGSLPEAQRLATGVDQFKAEQLRKALEFALPGGLAQAQQNISAELRGELPPDVAQSIIRSATAAGYARGFGPRSGIGGNLVARDLGLTSLKLQQQGLSSFAGLASFSTPQTFDITSMFFTPHQRLGFSTEERNLQYQRDLLKARVKAQPEPWKAALTQAIMNDEEMIMKMVGSVAGAAVVGCWVAREVYGESNPCWMVFRQWLFEDAPKWFKWAYMTFGESVARWIKNKPTIKLFIRNWMNQRIKAKYADRLSIRATA